jgi:hypothetical protein
MCYDPSVAARFRDLDQQAAAAEQTSLAGRSFAGWFEGWATACLSLLQRAFGPDSPYSTNFRQKYEQRYVTILDEDSSDSIARSKLESCAPIFHEAVLEYESQAPPAATQGESPPPPTRAAAGQLTGPQLRQFQQALLAAFPTPAALEELVFFELDTPLETIGIRASLSETVFRLIRWAQAQGRLAALGQAAVATNPGNPDLAAVVAALGFTVPATEQALAVRVADLEVALRARDAELVALRAQLTAAPAGATEVPLPSGQRLPAVLLVAHYARLLAFVREMARGSSSMQAMGARQGSYENQRTFARRAQREAAALLVELGEGSL